MTTDSPGSHDNVRLGLALRKAHTAVWRDLELALDSYEITPRQYAVMMLLAENPGSRLDFLAARLTIKSPNLLGLVDKLTDRGLIDRGVSRQDRRRSSISLTRDGEKLLKSLNKADRLHQRRMEALVGKDALKTLLTTLNQLSKIGELSDVGDIDD